MHKVRFLTKMVHLRILGKNNKIMTRLDELIRQRMDKVHAKHDDGSHLCGDNGIMINEEKYRNNILILA